MNDRITIAGGGTGQHSVGEIAFRHPLCFVSSDKPIAHVPKLPTISNMESNVENMNKLWKKRKNKKMFRRTKMVFPFWPPFDQWQLNGHLDLPIRPPFMYIIVYPNATETWTTVNYADEHAL